MTDGEAAWARACLALDLLFTDPDGLRGIVLTARAGPVRDTWLAALHQRSRPRRAHPMMTEDAFFGGVDVTASLGAGHVVETPGLLAGTETLVLAMAERCPQSLAARLGSRIDQGGPVVIALNEAAEDDEAVPPALADRLALVVSLDGIGRLEATPPPRPAAGPLPAMDTAKATETLVHIAAQLGVHDLRAPYFALRAASAHAALSARDHITDADLRAATELVLAPRATQLPDPPQDDAPQPEPDSADADPGRTELQDIPTDILVEAVLAALPDGLLDQHAPTGPTKAGGGGFGGARAGNRRGRPLPARAGRPGDGARIDIVATLRAAAPWQGVRGKTDAKVRIRPDDLRIRRYESLSDRVVIFAVDASGSAALNRLGEAKGAIELLLAEAYARRDHVALIAFRGAGAELVLPPTRSLTQVKRRLAALPGGGGTPLAAGLHMAAEVARSERARGLSPVIALLTDGRPNVALDGSPGRTQAGADADSAARRIAAAAVPGVVMDVSPRPNAALQNLSQTMRARYVPLPHASAERMSKALQRTMADELGP